MRAGIMYGVVSSKHTTLLAFNVSFGRRWQQVGHGIKVHVVVGYLRDVHGSSHHGVSVPFEY